MTQFSDLERENRALRERLSRLSEASLRINESLEFDTVLQEVLAPLSACSAAPATASSHSSMTRERSPRSSLPA